MVETQEKKVINIGIKIIMLFKHGFFLTHLPWSFTAWESLMKADTVFYFTTKQVTERQDLEEGQYRNSFTARKKRKNPGQLLLRKNGS